MIRLLPFFTGLCVAAAVAAAAQGCGPMWQDDHVERDFVLVGCHRDQSCASCHENQDFEAPLPTSCHGCHEDDQLEGHPDCGTDCARCHTAESELCDPDDPASWGEIVHDFFPLDGGHAIDGDDIVGCDTCHDTAECYDGLEPAPCTVCHEDDRPVGHFAGDCEGCHPITRWEDGVVDHADFFPIPHRGNGDCGDCHLADDNYATFSCTHCHEHRQSEMADKHDEVGGYSWDSDECLRCHPDGRAEDD